MRELRVFQTRCEVLRLEARGRLMVRVVHEGEASATPVTALFGCNIVNELYNRIEFPSEKNAKWKPDLCRVQEFHGKLEQVDRIRFAGMFMHPLEKRE